MAYDYIRRGQAFDISVDVSDSGISVAGATLRTVFSSPGGHEVVVDNDDHVIVSSSNYRIVGTQAISNKFKVGHIYTFVTEYQLGSTDSWIKVTQQYKVENSSRAAPEGTNC